MIFLRVQITTVHWTVEVLVFMLSLDQEVILIDIGNKDYCADLILRNGVQFSVPSPDRLAGMPIRPMS